jgi:hypothetical protein
MLPAAKVSVAISFAIGLSVLALAGPAVAQDAAKADTASAAATKQPDASSDRRKSRAERRAEAAAKSEPLAQFPKADGAAAASTEPTQPKMECRSQPVSGSRLGKRVCATPEQWAQADAAAAEAIRQMRSDASAKGGVTRPGGPYTVGGGP